MAAAGKKKYMVTLTVSRAERVQALIVELGLPRGSWSMFIDQALIGTEVLLRKMLEVKKSGDQLSMEDLLGFMVGEGLKAAQGKK